MNATLFSEENEAQEISGTDVLEPFSVIGSKENISGLTGSGYYIDSTELEVFNYTDVNQILKTVPGVYVRPEEGYGLFPNISLRGVDPNRSSKVTILRTAYHHHHLLFQTHLPTTHLPAEWLASRSSKGPAKSSKGQIQLVA